MYILAIIAILQGIFTLIEGLRPARHMRTYRPGRATGGRRVIVFFPCKGIDEDFEKNIHSILNQDYLNYAVQFIVESEDDPACRVLRSYGTNVLIAGRALDCGQK